MAIQSTSIKSEKQARADQREAARLIGIQIEDALRDQNFIEIDGMLRRADFSTLSIREATMMIRASSRAKARLPSWQPALRRFASYLKEKCPDRYTSLMVGLEEFVPAYCVLIDARLKTVRCPLENGKCYWQHRETNECCYTDCELTVEQFTQITGADPLSSTDIDEFKERLRAQM
jgi:hypothetical protein